MQQLNEGKPKALLPTPTPSIQESLQKIIETIYDLEGRVSPSNRGYLYQIRKSVEIVQSSEKSK